MPTLTMNPQISRGYLTMNLCFFFFQISFKKIKRKASKHISNFPVQHVWIHKTVTKNQFTYKNSQALDLCKYLTPSIFCTVTQIGTLTVLLILHQVWGLYFQNEEYNWRQKEMLNLVCTNRWLNNIFTDRTSLM